MSYAGRRPTLKQTYYRSFLLLIVIPLILVFACAEIVVSYIIRNSAIETIDAFQENIATTLSGDIRASALQLSHFVYANNGEFIQTAARVAQSSGSGWYEADQAIQRAFRTAMATDTATDRSGAVEAVAFFTVSRVGDVLSAQRREAGLGRSLILDREGHVLFGDMGDSGLRDYFEERLGRFVPGSLTRRAALAEGGERDYFFRTRSIPDTDWSVVTFVEESSLGRQFYQVGGILALIVAALMILFYFYSRYFLNAIIAPVQEVCKGMERLDRNDLEVRLEPRGQLELQNLMTSFNEMVLSIRNMLRVTEETLEKKHEAEIQALQSQINPHFIVNTLNSIRFMAQVAKFDGIRKMAEALVSIVSCSFRSNVSFYTVREELEMLETYVYLMRIRYSNGFEVRYDVEPACLDYLLPRLTLQPILENAITHGFDELTEELGQIKVSVYRREGFLCLSVWDNGRGMTPEEINRVLGQRRRKKDDNTSIGLENVQARIKLNFGESARLEIESEPEVYTRVVLKLPLAGCASAEEVRHDSNADRG